MLLGFDVICLCEVKTSLPVCLDTNVRDQIWVEFRNIPRVMFGFCYIPPCDSQYYSHEFFAAIQERIREGDEQVKYVIMGDLNSRFGILVRDLLPISDVGNSCHLSYAVINDSINAPNTNAEVLSSICRDNELIVINNLKTPDYHYVGNLTYKKRDTWISELYCIVLYH